MIKAVASYFKIFLGPFFHYRLKLNENKLTRLFSELKVLDKEHLALKRLKAENGDKDGLREAEMRKKVTFVSFRLECDLFTRRMTFLSMKKVLGLNSKSSIPVQRRHVWLWHRQQARGNPKRRRRVLSREAQVSRFSFTQSNFLFFWGGIHFSINQIQTWDGWVRSANSTTVPCPPASNVS